MPSDTLGKPTLACMPLLAFLAAAHPCDTYEPSHRVKTHSKVLSRHCAVMGFVSLFSEPLCSSAWLGWFMGLIFVRVEEEMQHLCCGCFLQRLSEERKTLQGLLTWLGFRFA